MEDSKPGVSADDLKELFEPLFRADRARQRSADGGSGLGLAIVRSIALAHGGSVHASHAGMGGLRMTVRLPLNGKRSAL
jgi:two-component system sensor histidine kinase BaeS